MKNIVGNENDGILEYKTEEKIMNWQEIYEQRKMTAKEAIKLIHSNDRVMIAHAVGVPLAITDVLVEHKEDYQNVEIVQMVSMGNAKFCEPGTEGHFRLNSLFLGDHSKPAVKEGRGDFTQCHLDKDDAKNSVCRNMYPVLFLYNFIKHLTG